MNTKRSKFFEIARRTTASCSAMLLVALMAVCPARAGVSCHLINAKGVGQDLGAAGTTGKLIGGGLLQGNVSGNITGTGISGTVASFVETVTFTNQHGTLTV